jgi:hypothetical protein
MGCRVAELRECLDDRAWIHSMTLEDTFRYLIDMIYDLTMGLVGGRLADKDTSFLGFVNDWT